MRIERERLILSQQKRDGPVKHVLDANMHVFVRMLCFVLFDLTNALFNGGEQLLENDRLDYVMV
jgi:hypothetical protein